jgi:hypothetical protein
MLLEGFKIRIIEKIKFDRITDIKKKKKNITYEKLIGNLSLHPFVLHSFSDSFIPFVNEFVYNY